MEEMVYHIIKTKTENGLCKVVYKDYINASSTILDKDWNYILIKYHYPNVYPSLYNIVYISYLEITPYSVISAFNKAGVLKREEDKKLITDMVNKLNEKCYILNDYFHHSLKEVWQDEILH